MAALQRVPGQAIAAGQPFSTQLAHKRHSHAPLLGLPGEPDVRFAHATALWLARMLCAIEDEYFPRDGLGRDQVWVLRHVARTVDLALMVDALNYLDARRGGQRVAAELAPLIVVVAPVEAVRRGAVVALWKVDGGNLEVVLGLPRRVRAKKDAVDSVGLVRGSGNSSIDGRTLN